MKNVILSIAIFTLLFTSCSKEDGIDHPDKEDGIDSVQSSCDFIDFKYYNGTQYSLGELSNDYVLIGIDTVYSDDEIQNFISTVKQLNQDYEYTIHNTGQYKYKEIPVKFNASKSCEEITQIISDLNRNTIISYVHYTMQTNDCHNDIWEPIGDLCINSYGSNFYVKVFDENDVTDLNQIIAQTNTELIGQNRFMPKWYSLRATKSSKGDALEMANYFYETKLFESSDPDITTYPVE